MIRELDHLRNWKSLVQRNRQPEWMDEPDLEASLHWEALAGLARINWWSRSAAILWPRLRQLALELRRPLRVVDLACGGGDVTLELARRASRSAAGWEFRGYDRSSTALELARQRAVGRGVKITFLELDVLQDELPQDADVLISSLFLHHLDESQAVQFLRRLAAATRSRFLINDLERSKMGYLLAVVSSRLLTGSSVVRLDGPLSIAGAFTVAEASGLARTAGCESVTFTRHWPCRYLLEWRKP